MRDLADAYPWHRGDKSTRQQVGAQRIHSDIGTFLNLYRLASYIPDKPNKSSENVPVFIILYVSTQITYRQSYIRNFLLSKKSNRHDKTEYRKNSETLMNYAAAPQITLITLWFVGFFHLLRLSHKHTPSPAIFQKSEPSFVRPQELFCCVLYGTLPVNSLDQPELWRPSAATALIRRAEEFHLRWRRRHRLGRTGRQYRSQGG